MKINNTIISKAIYMIMDHYNSLPLNGFCLHIEDQAPEGIFEKTVGKKNFGITVRTISEDELPPEVKAKLLRSRSVASISRVESIKAAFDDLLNSRKETAKKVKGFTAVKESVPPDYDGEVYDFVDIFYLPHIEMAENIIDLEALIKESVRHEWRHACQFNWLREHGINPMDALKIEDATEYGFGPLEKDAHEFGRGIENDINIAMASFLS